MDQFVIGEKVFRPYISAEKIAKRVAELAEKINRDYSGHSPLIVPVLNGAFIFAADLVRHLTIQPEVQFLRVSTYGNQMNSNESAEIILGADLKVKGRDILIIEDIVDTGYTSDFFMEHLAPKNPASVKLATLLFKPESFSGNRKPDYVGFEVPHLFVIGYGLDYAQSGRELPGIYILDEEG